MAQSRTLGFLRNSGWSLILQLVTILVGFLVPRAIIAEYGSEVNGLVSSLTQFVSYISLVEAGISAAAVYALYKPLAQRDISSVSRIVVAAKRFYFKSGWIFVALTALLAFAYPLFVNVPGFTQLQVAVLVFSLGAMGFLDFFTLAKYRVLLTASQQNWIIQIANILYKIIYALIILFLASKGVSIEVVYICSVLPVVLRSMSLSVITRKIHPGVQFAGKVDTFKLEQRWDAFFLQVLGVVQNGAPLIIATFLFDDLSLVSVFSIYLLVANGIQSVCASLGVGTQASFGDVIARGETQILKKSFSEFQVVSGALNAFMCGAGFVLCTPFVHLYAEAVTDVNYVYPILGFLVILNVFLYHLKTPQGLLVIAGGFYRETRVQTSIQTALLLVCSVLFGLIWRAPGIMLGCCISNLYRVFDLIWFTSRKLDGISTAFSVKVISLEAAQCFLMVVPWLLFPPGITSWLEWILCALCVAGWGVAVCLGTLWLVSKEQMIGLLGRLRRMAHHGAKR